MFEIEEKTYGHLDTEKIWELYSNVDQWKLWDRGIKSVSLFGGFAEGAKGLMETPDGRKLPFTIVECTINSSFSTKSELGNFDVTLVHTIEHEENLVSVSHRVIVDGGEDGQMEEIGRQIAAGLPECLQTLVSLSAK